MKKIYEICFGAEPSDKVLSLLEIQYQRLMDNGYSEKEARNIMLDNKLNVDDLIHEDSLIMTSDDSVYYHNELQIHSKPGYYNPETGRVDKQPYYLEMRYRYTMDDLLEYYYNKLSVPIQFRNTKRDIGAFKHILNDYKFNNMHTVDFILYIIDYTVANEIRICNPLDLKNWAQQTYEYLESYILCYKPKVVYREELI